MVEAAGEGEEARVGVGAGKVRGGGSEKLFEQASYFIHSLASTTHLHYYPQHSMLSLGHCIFALVLSKLDNIRFLVI